MNKGMSQNYKFATSLLRRIGLPVQPDYKSGCSFILRVNSKGLLVTLKRLSSKDWTHPNPLCSLSNVHRTFS